ncbi:protein SYG1 [Chaetomidium leptoderma]|uniref:Protein SYG1 n=1 Tax=Chaetomidium leptoderma TaxID=669021 RepID=A0AAN6VTP7_9PEZI|nr:protein SYG1 [Chaetomidium leptoderma]
MKFAKELDQDAVPEWRVKYLNYKAGKKHVKNVTRAINRANATPTLTRRTETPQAPQARQANTPASFFGINHSFTPPRRTNQPGNLVGEPGLPRSGSAAAKPGSSATQGDERSGLARTPGSGVQYGSFGLPPSRASDRNEFELPAPALRVPSNTGDPTQYRLALQRSATVRATGRPDHHDHRSPSLLTLPSGGMATTPRLRVSRLFTNNSTTTRQTPNKMEIGMQNLDYVRSAERDFFAFLDSELDKIETFYKDKEDQATERLAALRAQLHEMRNRRTAEIAEAKRKREQGRNGSDEDAEGRSKDGNRDWIGPLKDRFLKPGPNSKALQKMTRTPVMAGQTMDEGRDYVRVPQGEDVPYRTAKRKLKLALQEFYRSLELLKSYAVLNRTALRKLNKKYDKAVHARPPYRYMNEKVNKSWFVNSDILDGHIRTVEDLYARYFEKGNHKIAAGKLRALHKRTGDSSDSAFRSGLLIGIGAVFAVQGLIYGTQFLLGDDEDDNFVEETSYLMQLYGGYFLVLLLFSLFTLVCRVWTKNKVNYPFIFEFDARNFLDWRQLAEFPSFFFALFGVLFWLNFSRLGNWEDMYLYYPVILVGISLVILFFPAPILHHKARRWFLYSHYRLLLSGLYPVEFRDFFLGDIWCSLTYAVCNIELFFCLYANRWNDPVQCNSSHSRLLGFFAALPPIWRALQCIRRYRDTRNVFPHLVNCGKYTMTILTALWLSLYRIGDSNTNLSFFIAFASINAVYCSIWDLFMDFSLLQAGANKKLLRNITAIRPVWIYYVIMVVDPILRFSWIFYAIFTHNTQHSTLVSFMVALAEVVRRGMWTLLRVENEHCANVAQYKAARDTPLPYTQLEQFVQRPSLEAATAAAAAAATATPTTTTTATAAVLPTPSPRPRPRPASERPGTAAKTPTPAAAGRDWPVDGGVDTTTATATTTAMEEGGIGIGIGPSGTFRRRGRADTLGKRSILQAMAEAHKQDFEKRRPAVGEQGGGSGGGVVGDEDDDDDDEDEDEEEEILKSEDEEDLRSEEELKSEGGEEELKSEEGGEEETVGEEGRLRGDGERGLQGKKGSGSGRG